MDATDLRTLETPITPLPLDGLPPSLVERAVMYNDAVDAFREVLRGVLGELQGGGCVNAERAEELRAAAADLVTAREWLLEIARLPASARRAP